MTALDLMHFRSTAITVLVFLFITNSFSFAAESKQKKTITEDEQRTVNQVGRYQVIPVEYERIDDGRRVAIKSVIKNMILSQGNHGFFLKAPLSNRTEVL